jgi:protein FRG1
MLKSLSGTFLTAGPSGTLTADTPSRGPLEAFKAISQSTSTPFPSYAIRTQSDKHLSVSDGGPGSSSSKTRFELRADADSVGESETVSIKCQREFVFKAKVSREGEEGAMRRRRFEGGAAVGSVQDEIRRK